jgi:two-component system, sensor histidine kinase YesM
MSMKFSKRLVLVYTCIVVIPLFILICVISFIVERRQYMELRQKSNASVEEHARLIEKNIESFDLIERMINGNGELMLFFTIPENNDENAIINTMIDEATTIERTLSVLPEIYAVRIFTDSPVIPERWPVFMNSSRTKLSSLRKWEYNYTADYLGNLNSLKYSSVCTTRPIYRNKRRIGSIQIAMKMTDFFPFLYERSDEYQNDYVFTELQLPENGLEVIRPVVNSAVEEQQGTLSRNDIKNIAASVHRAGIFNNGQLVLRTGPGTRFVSWERVPDMGIIIVHSNSTGMIEKNIVLLRIAFFFGLAATAATLFFLIRYTTSRLMSGVYSVMNGMKEVREGNLDVVVPVEHSDEVGESEETFNSMTEQLRAQIEQIRQEQSLIADTEMKAMQNQINAHFLYNVLETIRMQAEIADQKDIAESIEVLGKMMRYCLRWRVHVVTLDQEIEYIRSYVYILNIRNDYVISLETEIPPQYASLEIPKMIMQPLIENAFTHAIEPAGKDAVIRVSAEPDTARNRLVLCVQDFGCGMSAQTLETIRTYLADDSYERDSKGSIGLKNIQQRLTMYYGKDFRMTIESEEGRGTRICVPVPLDKVPGQEN